MGRRYDDDVDVQLGAGSGGGGGQQGPTAFVWQQRLYQVREVLGHWHEGTPWWESSGERRLEAGTGDREVWRVAASAGRVRGTGTYDLGRAPEDPGGSGGALGGRWQLLEVVD